MSNSESNKPMVLKEWETIIQKIMDETNQEPNKVAKQRLLVEWRAKLEKQPPHLAPYRIDEIVREVRRRLDEVTGTPK